jgi:hypothetical protein
MSDKDDLCPNCSELPCICRKIQFMVPREDKKEWNELGHASQPPDPDQLPLF